MTIGPADKKTLVTTPANPLSEEWWALVIDANKEAARLNMRLAMNACDGWALAGGPWITPELSMQQIVRTTDTVDGGKPFAVAACDKWRARSLSGAFRAFSPRYAPNFRRSGMR